MISALLSAAGALLAVAPAVDQLPPIGPGETVAEYDDDAALRAAHPQAFAPAAAPAPALMPILAWRDRFTPAEKAAIHGAALADGAVAAVLDDLRAREVATGTMDPTSARTAAALAVLVEKGLVAADRVAALTAPAA